MVRPSPLIRLVDVGLDHRRRLGVPTVPGVEQQRAVPQGRVAGRLRDRVGLLDQRRGCGEFTGVHVHNGTVGQGKSKDTERAGVASPPDRASGQLMPCLVVPHVAGDQPRQPEPAHGVVLVTPGVLPERL